MKRTVEYCMSDIIIIVIVIVIVIIIIIIIIIIMLAIGQRVVLKNGY